MDLERLYSNLSKLDVVSIAVDVLNQLTGFITELNRIQIEEKGKRSDNSILAPPYAESTKKKKSRNSGIGAITGHITLHDKEGISSAFSTVIQNDVLSITQDNIIVKGFDLGSHLLETYGNYLGLTDESIVELNEKFWPIFIEKLESEILR